jgi:hypothetical protein
MSRPKAPAPESPDPTGVVALVWRTIDRVTKSDEAADRFRRTFVRPFLGLVAMAAVVLLLAGPIDVSAEQVRPGGDFAVGPWIWRALIFGVVARTGFSLSRRLPKRRRRARKDGPGAAADPAAPPGDSSTQTR